MRIPRPRGLLAAAVLLLAACAGDERSSSITTPDGISSATLKSVRMTLTGGGGQAGNPGQPLAGPVVVQVTDGRGRPVADEIVSFVTRDGHVQPRQARTDANGFARTEWTLGAGVGAQALRVTGTGGSLVVAAQAVPGGGARTGIVKIVGDDQTGTAGDALALPVRVQVVRDDGRLVAGAKVLWRVETGGGRVGRASSLTAATGLTHEVWTLGAEAGTQTLTASVEGVGSVTFTATAAGPLARDVALLRLQPDSLVLDAGATAALTLVVLDPLGVPIPGYVAKWTSSDAAVATVDGHGRVTAVGTGTARVTASLGLLSASATVRVRGTPASIRIQPDSLVLDRGTDGRLTAVVRDASGAVLPGVAVTWSSSMPSIASVDGDGTVHGLKTGTVRVTAKAGSLTAMATVRVRLNLSAVVIPLIQNRVSSTGGPIDPAQRDLTLNFWVHTSDSLATISLRIRGPQGHVESCANVDAAHYTRREFGCQVYLSRGADPGVWRVDEVTVSADGRTHAFSYADLERMGTAGRALDVLGTGADASPPQVRTVWPHQGTRYPDHYGVNLGVTDHVSGVRSVQATVRTPAGETRSCDASASYGVGARQGTWYCRLPLAMGSGTWHLVSISATDMAGNTATYTPEQIDAWRGVSELTYLQYTYTP